jgi:hypothetical protein
MGANAVAKEIQIIWPSGIEQVLRDVTADRVVAVSEPQAAKDINHRWIRMHTDKIASTCKPARTDL